MDVNSVALRRQHLNESAYYEVLRVFVVSGQVRAHSRFDDLFLLLSASTFFEWLNTGPVTGTAA